MVLHALNSPASLYPSGATVERGATTFRVHAPEANKVDLCLFAHDGEEERVPLEPTEDGQHQLRVTGVRAGQEYGYRVQGKWRPELGRWFNHNKLLADPYARQISGAVTGSPVLRAGETEPDPVNSAAETVRSVVTDNGFEWGPDSSPAIPWDSTLLYETHVKGMTYLHPEIEPNLRGTFAGLGSEPILDHLTKLGVTAVELLPVHTRASEPFLIDRGLTNYWGYSTLGFFSPDRRFAATDDPVREFKEMVAAFHRRGIEVILDVVYNHTAEGNHEGPMLSFRGFDNPGFYRLDPERPSHYLDRTGTGHTVDLTQAWARQLVLDSLRYWVGEMRVDGFRFDLAPALARQPDEFSPEAPFLTELIADPVLSTVKLIAEPWDLGLGGYQLGNFPEPFRELNGRFRDTMREVWRGTPGTIDDFADRLTGSSGTFHHRGPTASINFVTNHDGFTLSDLVSYDVKHNDANGEENRDGETNNRSWNSGTEGPTDDRAITELRRRRAANFLATTLLAQGVPMLLGGDELGRTQGGNNNAYGQDNETSWFDWESADRDRVELVAQIALLRRDHPVLRRPTYPTGNPASDGVPDFGWFTPRGEIMTETDWETAWVKTLGVFWNGTDLDDESFYLILNASTEATTFHLPDMLDHWSWQEVLATGSSQAHDPNPTLPPFSLALYRTR